MTAPTLFTKWEQKAKIMMQRRLPKGSHPVINSARSGKQALISASVCIVSGCGMFCVPIMSDSSSAELGVIKKFQGVVRGSAALSCSCQSKAFTDVQGLVNFVTGWNHF